MKRVTEIGEVGAESDFVDYDVEVWFREGEKLEGGKDIYV